MTKELLERIMNVKGQIVTLKWNKTCKTKKSCEDTITKDTIAKCVRIGCGYDNLSVVKEGRENGELPTENAGLPASLEWEVYPTLLRNKFTGKQFVRVETMSNSIFNSNFYKNGREVSKESILDVLLASEKSRGERPVVMNIPLENITELVCGG